MLASRNAMKAKYDRLYSTGLMHLAKGNVGLAEKYLNEAAIQLKEYGLTLNGEEKSETRELMLELIGQIKDLHGERSKDTAQAEAQGEGTTFAFSRADIPNISFKDVVGLESVKEQVYDMIIYPRQYSELYAKFKKKIGGGILLYGPPGNGKTMIAKAIANETGSVFFPIKFSDLGSKWFGETEGKIKALFDEARKAESAVIFFDEIDAIASKRTDSSIMDRVVAELLTQIDGVNKGGGNLTILAATNKIENLDPAILRPGRFDEKIYIPLPDLRSRASMLRKRLEGIPSSVTDINEIATACEGLSGAEIELICEKAKQRVIRNIISGKIDKDSVITNSDMYEVISKIRA